MKKVWIVTGAASGLGREISRAALKEGYTVVLTDRRTEGAQELIAAYPDHAITMELDVTNNTQITTVVNNVVERYGKIDVLINAAGRGHICAVEETTESELRALVELSFFGPAALTKAVLPHMRKQGSGAIVQITSQAGQMSDPGMGAYSAGKFALEGLSVALAKEVAPLGIKVLIAQPGPMRTSFATGKAISESNYNPAYEATVGELRKHVEEFAGKEKGDPVKVAAAILAVLEDYKTPLRLPLTNVAFDTLVADAKQIAEERVIWESVSRAVDFSD